MVRRIGTLGGFRFWVKGAFDGCVVKISRRKFKISDLKFQMEEQEENRERTPFAKALGRARPRAGRENQEQEREL